MRTTTLSALSLLGAMLFTAAPALAQRNVAAGTVTIDARAAAVGVGYTWGDGVLNFHGRSYRFTVNGVSVADVGFAHVYGRGHVYNLKNLHDFDGTYAAADGEATLVKGIGGQLLRNSNGVSIRLDNVSRGARLAASADGIQLTLK